MSDREQQLELLALLEERKKRRVGEGIWEETQFERKRRALFALKDSGQLEKANWTGYGDRLHT